MPGTKLTDSPASYSCGVVVFVALWFCIRSVSVTLGHCRFLSSGHPRASLSLEPVSPFVLWLEQRSGFLRELRLAACRHRELVLTATTEASGDHPSETETKDEAAHAECLSQGLSGACHWRASPSGP